MNDEIKRLSEKSAGDSLFLLPATRVGIIEVNERFSLRERENK